MSVPKAILKARGIAENKLKEGVSADEFVEIGDADGFKVYVTVGRTLENPTSFHENPRDVFMWIMEGKMQFEFEDGRKSVVKSGECFFLSKHVRHRCIFKELTIAIAGVYEKGLP